MQASISQRTTNDNPPRSYYVININGAVSGVELTELIDWLENFQENHVEPMKSRNNPKRKPEIKNGQYLLIKFL